MAGRRPIDQGRGNLPPAPPRPRHIGFIGFDDVMALDIVGPMDAFALAASPEHGSALYACVVLGLSRRSFVAESGLKFRADRLLDDAPALDTLVIPGGRGLRAPAMQQRLAPWLRANARKFRRIVSVCTGIYGLAASGLLDGRRVTTHWRFADAVARQFPALKVQANAIYIKDGCFYTSAGVTAGIDLALALIEEDHPGPLALAIGRELVVHHKRAGGQEQYSEPFRFQVEATDRLGEVAAWVPAHLGSSLTVERLAERACMSSRHFARAFKHAFGMTPADFVERQRLDQARDRLTGSRRSIAQIAHSIGFRSADAFSRAFHRCYGLTPSTYRRSRAGADAGQERGWPGIAAPHARTADACRRASANA